MNKQKTSQSNFGIYSLYVLGAIACFAFFQFCYPYHLFYQEQNQLFLMSWDYITTYLDKPGWLACLAGDFLTQFYYFRYAGPIILTLCILLTGYNIRCAVEMADIKGRGGAHSVAFIVMILLICFSFHNDYRLSSILAVAGGASVFRVSTSLLISTRMFIKKIESRNEQGLFLNGSGIANWVSVISIFVSIFVCHWFFGYGVWVFYVQTGLYLQNKGYKEKEGDYELTANPMYLEIPVLASYRYNFSDAAQLQINVGPYFAYGVGGKIKETDEGDEDKWDCFGDKGADWKRFDCGLQIGAGLTIAKNYYIGAAYEFGFSNIAKNSGDGKLKNKNWMFSVGYNF